MTTPGLRLAAALALLLAACGTEPAEPPQPEAPPLQFERASADPLRHGERLARVLGCRGCHGDDVKGYLWSDDPEDVLLYTSNLRRAVPAYSDSALDRAIRAGARPDGSPLWGMPSEIFVELDSADVAALIRYLRSLPAEGEVHPRPVFGPAGRREIERGTLRAAPDEVRRGRGVGPPALGGGHDWARYMIRATCSECHKLDLTGHGAEAGPRPPPDLIVAGAYTREQFRRLMRSGEPPDGRDLGLMKQVSRRRFAHLTPREVDAIYDYLLARAQSPR